MLQVAKLQPKFHKSRGTPLFVLRSARGRKAGQLSGSCSALLKSRRKSGTQRCLTLGEHRNGSHPPTALCSPLPTPPSISPFFWRKGERGKQTEGKRCPKGAGLCRRAEPRVLPRAGGNSSAWSRPHCRSFFVNKQIRIYVL